MAYLNPAWLKEIGAVAPVSGFTVYSVGYPDAQGNRHMRQWSHSTRKACLRRLGSVCSGKLRNRGDHSAFAMNPQGETFSYNELKEVLK